MGEVHTLRWGLEQNIFLFSITDFHFSFSQQETKPATSNEVSRCLVCSARCCSLFAVETVASCAVRLVQWCCQLISPIPFFQWARMQLIKQAMTHISSCVFFIDCFMEMYHTPKSPHCCCCEQLTEESCLALRDGILLCRFLLQSWGWVGYRV